MLIYRNQIVFNIIYINPIFTTMLVRPYIKPLLQLCSYNLKSTLQYESASFIR